MVRHLPVIPQEFQPTTQVVESEAKQAPEDASMKNGVFREYNTEAPNETRVHQLFSLQHKTAIVSGAGAGIGLQVAQAFAEAGANVAIWYHSNNDALDRAADIEKAYGVKCKSAASAGHRSHLTAHVRPRIPSRCHL